MSVQFSAVDTERGQVVITTDELALHKVGGVAPSTDGKSHELVVTVSKSRSGWINVDVAEAASWERRPMNYGFQPATKTTPCRWSYSQRPPQAIVDCMKLVRTAQRQAREAAAAQRLAAEQAAAVTEAAQIVAAPRDAVAAALSEIPVRAPIQRANIPEMRRECEQIGHQGRGIAVAASVAMDGERRLLLRDGYERVQRYVCAACLVKLKRSGRLHSIAYVED